MVNVRALAWNGLGAVLLTLGGGPGSAQTTPPPDSAAPGFATVPMSAPQRAALVLGRWETCIDVSVNFLARTARRPERVATEAEKRCDQFAAQLRPIMAQSLRDMMYGSAEPEVVAQTDAAMDALRRHIGARAMAAAERARARP